MKLRMCEKVHEPPFSYGDCMRACVSTLINDDNVPHVFDGKCTHEESWQRLRDYLKSKGKFLFFIELDDPFDFMKDYNTDIPYILIHSSKSGNHAVICVNDIILHDPSYYKQEIKDSPT